MIFRKLCMFARYQADKLKMSLPSVVFVLGGPGAGKGTQCLNIVKEFGYTHLSAGDLLRAERKKPGSKVGEEIERHITNGTIVPVEVTCGLLKNAMDEVMDKDANKNNLLIDGFPRNLDNREGWDKEMGDKSNVKFVLFFDCSEEVCMQRCLDRGQAGSGRSDDNKESLNKRIVTYNNSTRPIIDYYNEKGMVHTVDASKSPEEVFAEVKKLFS